MSPPAPVVDGLTTGDWVSRRGGVASGMVFTTRLPGLVTITVGVGARLLVAVTSVAATSVPTLFTLPCRTGPPVAASARPATALAAAPAPTTLATSTPPRVR